MQTIEELKRSTHEQLRNACKELDQRLRGGDRCAAEDFFARFPLLASEEDSALELVYTEFVTREDLRQRPAPEEYYSRFPHWKNRLQRQFHLHELLRNASDSELPASEDLPPVCEAEGQVFCLGHYEVREQISRGGFGAVYKAWQQGLDRVVAVKVLLPRYRHDPRARQRFCHEARVLAALRHPHIMPVHEVGEWQGTLYFSMDYIPGGSLADRLRSERMDEHKAACLLATVAHAVHHAHQRGVIHCDLKPSNILLDDPVGPLVSDFGLAHLPADPGIHDPHALVGTPAYMAPEQLRSGVAAVTPATDIWALGVVLYEMLSGRRPFEGPGLADLEHQICESSPAPLSECLPAVDDRLAGICARCLSRDPARRYPSAAALATALEQCQLA